MRRLPYLLPWVRIELLLRSMLEVRWNGDTWPIIRVHLRRSLEIRSALAREGGGS
jgi:hypothetical protein